MRRNSSPLRLAFGALAFVLALALAAALPAPVSAQALDPARLYVVAVDDDYAPFSTATEKGAILGFDADIARALCVEMKIRCELKAVPFKDILPGVTEGSIDWGANGHSWSEARAKVVDFTARYYQTASIFYQFGDKYKEATPDSVKGLKVGVHKGTTLEAYLRERYGKAGAIVGFEGFEDLSAALRKGEIDLGLAEELTVSSFLGLKDGQGFSTVGGRAPAEVANFMIVSHGAPGLREAIDRALKALKENGTYERIGLRYFPAGID